jgi:hypothetical protein
MKIIYMYLTLEIYMYLTFKIYMYLTLEIYMYLTLEIYMTWSQISVYWLRSLVASKLNLRPSNLQLMP